MPPAEILFNRQIRGKLPVLPTRMKVVDLHQEAGSDQKVKRKKAETTQMHVNTLNNLVSKWEALTDLKKDWIEQPIVSILSELNPACYERRHFLVTTVAPPLCPKYINSGRSANNDGENGTQCCAYGCSKRRKKKVEGDFIRSDSEGSEDEETAIKKQFPRTFHSRV